ncbi:MAG TPA: flagellar export protein FliJ [Candidatus Cybelea sp.]|jgi:flagellar FliJ protein|nr:flagellar export protein FliJ [Candidatus Cybelea sp.]
MAARFRFQLQPLLDERERAEREKHEVFCECGRSAGESASAIERLTRARRRCERFLAGAGRVGAVRDAHLFDAQLRSLESTLERERLRHAALHARCERAREELAAARRERRVIEKLKQRRRRAFDLAEARREELDIDEANARRGVRR